MRWIQTASRDSRRGGVERGVRGARSPRWVNHVRIDLSQAAEEQLSRVELLATAGEYRYAREQLRLGALSNLNKDLRAFSNDLDGVSDEQERGLKSAVQVRDARLSRQLGFSGVGTSLAPPRRCWTTSSGLKHPRRS